VGFGMERLSGLQLGVILNRQNDGWRAFIHRNGQAFCQKIVRERSTHVIREPDDESVQLYAVNTSGQGLCNTNAHFRPVFRGKRPVAQISGPNWYLRRRNPDRHKISWEYHSPADPMAFDAGRDFKPGEKCEASGIYLVTHDRNHVSAHEVTVILGEPFPLCRGCGQHARFRAARLALHVSNDPNLKTLPSEHDAFLS
jgi:hypothetical protein